MLQGGQKREKNKQTWSLRLGGVESTGRESCLEKLTMFLSLSSQEHPSSWVPSNLTHSSIPCWSLLYPHSGYLFLEGNLTMLWVSCMVCLFQMTLNEVPPWYSADRGARLSGPHRSGAEWGWWKVDSAGPGSWSSCLALQHSNLTVVELHTWCLRVVQNLRAIKSRDQRCPQHPPRDWIVFYSQKADLYRDNFACLLQLKDETFAWWINAASQTGCSQVQDALR